MLGFLLAMWGRQLWGNFHTLSRFFSGRLLIGLLIAVPLVGGLWVGQRVVTASQRTTAFAPLSPASPLPRDYPRLERPAPDFALLDQHGHTLSLAAQRGEVRILTFAFGHCSTICPTIVHTARAALEGSADVSPGLWVITLDPWRDTPGALPALAAKWQLTGEKMHLLSADIDTVLAVLNAYNMPQQRDLRTGDITHPALVYVIDANGRIAYAFNNPTTAWLIDALRRAARPDLS
jgi:cytochrome oxidase Cu insertion factor (SCO1/SenC/PrrC family)